VKQNEIIQQLSDKELKKQLFLSQLIFFIISLVLSLFLFDSLTDWLLYFNWDINEMIYYGLFPGFIIVGIDLIIIRFFPKKYYDDGGINERIFSNQSVLFILLLSFTVAVSEELLFRGVIQTTFGFVFASLLFAFVHIRYLSKPVLFFSVLFVSLYIGYLFEITGNLVVTITTHFVVDFLLGLLIRLKK